MAGVSRGRIVSAIITSAVLTGLVAGVIVFVSQQDSQRMVRSATQALAAATPTDSVTTQFTPAPGITVTVSATPTHGSSSSSSSSSTTSYTGGSNGSITTIVPPRYPTPAPTSSASAGGSGGNSTPTPTATSPAATPTVTAPPVLKDDATVSAYSPTSLDLTSSAPSTIAVSLTMYNAGASTWDSSAGYAIKCQQFCWQIWGVTPSTFSVAPGQTFTFTGYLHPQIYMYATGNAVWQMYSPHNGYFGQQAVISIVAHGWYSALQETSPSCESDGSVWSRATSAGTVTCQSGDLALAQGGPGSVSMALTSIPSGYSHTLYMAKVHVHFSTTSSTTFAGIILTTPTSANYNEELVYMVSPGGYFCYTNLLTSCVTSGTTWSLHASSDYDITVVVSSATSYSANAGSSGGSLIGGFSGGGATGLVELTASGSTDAAYFSNYQLYQYK